MWAKGTYAVAGVARYRAAQTSIHRPVGSASFMACWGLVLVLVWENDGERETTGGLGEKMQRRGDAAG